MRINKYIAGTGICSRRKAEELVVQGRIKVNDNVVSDLSLNIEDNDIVKLDNKIIKLEENKVYLMLNKPAGYVTTSKEQFNRPSVLELINISERVFAVGRLDMDSEGLLLLTNDGEFMNNIIHPTKHISKTYNVKLRNSITNDDISLLESGVDIGDYITRPAVVKKVTDKNIIITIWEGKNRQIRKMCEAVNNKVTSLKRIEIGKLKLGNLQTGKFVKLTDKDLNKIFE